MQVGIEQILFTLNYKSRLAPVHKGEAKLGAASAAVSGTEGLGRNLIGMCAGNSGTASAEFVLW